MFTDEIMLYTEKYYPKGVELRHHIHQYPELSEHEVETAALVADTLRKEGIETRTSIGGNGVLGIVRGGRPGKTVLLRADMDALALDEAADVPYRSVRPGIMHACGHDGHTVGLLMAGMVLNELKDRLPGTVKLMFQPAEETVGGADLMIEAGILKNPPVDAAFGCHLWGDAKEGTVLVKAGPVMAAPDEFRIRIKGTGGHGGMPHLAVDPLPLAAQIILQFQTIVSRRKNPLEPAVLSVCTVRGGDTYNVIPETVDMMGTIRTFTGEMRDFIPGEMEKVLRGITSAAGALYTFDVTKRFLPLVNDEAATAIVRKAAEKIVGPDSVHEAVVSMGGEDFACIAKNVPSSFFFVGIAREGKPVIQHSPHFRWDDGVLRVVAACLCQTAIDFLHES
ncbi:MAG: amidohydrolase [Spirochaetaceae bacterium]|jgi:amidohydrolase|nr:amidohydrolase [Spirochaetaceae bacterium]